MMKRLIILALVVLATAEKFSYKDYKVYRIWPTTAEQLNILQKFETDITDSYSFWNGPTRGNVSADLMVSPAKATEFVELMADVGMKYSVYIEDVQALIDAENPVDTSKSSDFTFTRYHTLDQIYSWLNSLAVKYPKNVEVIVGGTTYENRQIKGIKISFAKGNPGVFIEGGIHAREWISPATITYIINELLTSKDRDVRSLAESHDWYIFPVFNPDGFVYTHTSSRLWRKTRSYHNIFCRGADPNRNWGYQWMTGGASSNPCMETFAGRSAFSEIETKTMSEYIASISDKFYAYISFHSYSQLLLIPYGHSTAHLDNYDDLYAIGIKAANKLSERYGTTYTTGNIAETIYVASGGSMDWVKATFGTPITYTYELRDVGRHGFVLPAEQIIPTGEETLDSLVALFKESKLRGYPASRPQVK